jgi:hypothetical protein
MKKIFNTASTVELIQDENCGHINNTLADVAAQSVLLKINHLAKKVEETFEDDPELAGVIIVDEDDGQLLGMISRKRFMELYSKPFRKELYNKKPLKLIVKYDFDTPLCLNESDDIDHAVRTALSRPHDQMYEPIVVRSLSGTFKLIDMQVLLIDLAMVYERQSLVLQETLSRVKQLEGIISICMYCKKIRNDVNSWDQMEVYISNHSEALFSHGICPDCYKKEMEELHNGTDKWLGATELRKELMIEQNGLYNHLSSMELSWHGDRECNENYPEEIMQGQFVNHKWEELLDTLLHSDNPELRMIGMREKESARLRYRL